MICGVDADYEPIPLHDEPPEPTPDEIARTVRRHEIRMLFEIRGQTFVALVYKHGFSPREICEALDLRSPQHLQDVGFAVHHLDADNTNITYSWSPAQWDEIFEATRFDSSAPFFPPPAQLTPLWMAASGMSKEQLENTFHFRFWSHSRKREFFSDANVRRLSEGLRLSDKALPVPLLRLTEQEWADLVGVRITDGVHLNFKRQREA
jgi:hypothetical protein